MRFAFVAAAAGLAASGLLPASAADLVVLSAAAVRSAVVEAPAKFESASGHRVRFMFGTAGEIRAKVAAGDPVDVVIVPPAQIADLVKNNLVVDGTRTDLGLVRLGAAVRAGAKPPAIGTAAEFKQAILEAPSFGAADPASGATTGIYLAKLMQQIGIADAIKGKLKLYPDGTNAMEAVARGEIALAAGQISEIKPVKGVELVGAIPEELQLKTIYAAGLAAKSASPEAARALITFLASPAMEPAFKASGFDAPAR